MIGIYKIQCKINNKVYIGYSSNIKKRFYLHKFKLKNNKHENSYLQNAWNKYSEDAFSFIIIEECLLNLCIEREDYYVKKHKSYFRKFGYNLAITGIGNIGKMPKYIIKKTQKTKKANALKRGYYFTAETIKKQVEGRKGFKHSSETIEKIRIASINRKKSKEVTQKTIDANNITINQYSLENKYIKTFKSITEALFFLNKTIKSGHISNCCKNKRKSAYGYKWKYKN